ncbi:PHB depolymerase family esterase [Spongiivirga sp. MCCC 1A20706]|uniref:alpha/beta hydrolase family esterase n=1 Tax=Spongiivirga sp. MCCC 1A20706 TaxID=3160963 RepID=UPI003977A71E
MKVLPILFTFLALLLSTSCESDENDNNELGSDYVAGLRFFEMSWESRSRTYQIYFPSEEFSDQNMPILFVLHGGGGNATDMQRSTLNRFNELAEIHGFIVVYPEGFEKQWNDGRDVTGIVTAWDENIDDVGYVAEIAKQLTDNFNIDERRIFTSGISNGGFMSSRLLCDRSDLFSGGAIITATLSETYSNNCNPDDPNSIIVFNGTEDPLVPYEGGQVTILGQERGLVLGTEAYMQFLATANGCETTPLISSLPDNEDDGTTVQLYEYISCTNQSKIQLYRIEGGGHTWPGGQELLPEVLVGKTSREIIACDVIWEFFSSL